MLNPIEEKKFEELRKMCRELKTPAPPEIMIGLKVVDKNGVLVFDDTQRAHSWVRNLWNMMFMTIGRAWTGSDSYTAGNLCLRREGSYINQLYPFSSTVYITSIIVGTDDTATSIADYMLGAEIASGNGAGELLASPFVVADPPTYAAKVWTSVFSTIFNNNSGGSITVKETGLLNTSQVLLFERSVLSPTVAVADGAQLTVTYTINMDFSSID